MSFMNLFWYDGEQGNNRCLCLSHIFMHDLSVIGGIILHLKSQL